jgi:hypothetical protein
MGVRFGLLGLVLAGCGSAFSTASVSDGGSEASVDAATDSAGQDGAGQRYCADKSSIFLCEDFDDPADPNAWLQTWIRNADTGSKVETTDDHPFSPPRALVGKVPTSSAIWARGRIECKKTLPRTWNRVVLGFDLRIDALPAITDPMAYVTVAELRGSTGAFGVAFGSDGLTLVQMDSTETVVEPAPIGPNPTFGQWDHYEVTVERQATSTTVTCSRNRGTAVTKSFSAVLVGDVMIFLGPSAFNVPGGVAIAIDNIEGNVP